MLPCVCSVIDHRWRQNVVRTKKWHRFSLLCLPWSFFQRPRKAEKRDLGNEVDYLIDTKLALKANAVFNIFIRCSSSCCADALGQRVPFGSGISHTWWPACFACTTWNGNPLTGAPLINKQNKFFKTFPCCFTFRNFRAHVLTYFQSSMLLRTFYSFGGIPA